MGCEEVGSVIGRDEEVLVDKGVYIGVWLYRGGD